jgi:hypothetical protein
MNSLNKLKNSSNNFKDWRLQLVDLELVSLYQVVGVVL